MVPVFNAGPAVAAMLVRARREIISHFLGRNAVNAGAAVSFEPSSRIQRRQFERMQDAGVVVPVGRDRFYIDPPSLDSWQQGRRKRARLAVLGALSAIGIGVAAGLIS